MNYNYLRPTIWTVILFIFISVFFYSIGYDSCASCCPNLEEGQLCIAMCCTATSPYFMPFWKISPLFTAAYWYVMAALIVVGATLAHRKLSTGVTNANKKRKKSKAKK